MPYRDERGRFAVEPGPSNVPVPKVQAAGTAGALSVVVIWVAAQLGLQMPAEVGAGIAALAAFVGGYLKRDT